MSFTIFSLFSTTVCDSLYLKIQFKRHKCTHQNDNNKSTVYMSSDIYFLYVALLVRASMKCKVREIKTFRCRITHLLNEFPLLIDTKMQHQRNQLTYAMHDNGQLYCGFARNRRWFTQKQVVSS